MAPDLKKIFSNIFLKTEKKKLCKKYKIPFLNCEIEVFLSLRIVISQHIMMCTNLMSN